MQESLSVKPTDFLSAQKNEEDVNMAVASLVLGIISLVIAVAGGAAGLGWIGSICGIIAVILGAISKKDPAQKGKATAGLVCGIIALSWGIIATIACMACLGATASALNW